MRVDGDALKDRRRYAGGARPASELAVCALLFSITAAALEMPLHPGWRLHVQLRVCA